jgi:thioredoxin-like negative regulator of GroEL
LALGILPAAPRYRYHHAVLLHRQQKSDEAAGELRTALASPRQFPERQAAQKLLATLTGKKP